MCGDSWSHLAIRRESYHLPIVCTRECSVIIVMSRLKHRTAVDTGVIANGAQRSDHCNVITSSFHVNGEGHSKPKVIHSKSLDQTRNTSIEPSRLVYAPNLIPYERLHLFKYGGVTMFNLFPCTSWQRHRFSKSDATRIWMKISGICEFRVITEIMTKLIGRCL